MGPMVTSMMTSMMTSVVTSVRPTPRVTKVSVHVGVAVEAPGIVNPSSPVLLVVAMDSQFRPRRRSGDGVHLLDAVDGHHAVFKAPVPVSSVDWSVR